MLFCLCLSWRLWMSMRLVLSLSHLVLLVCGVALLQEGSQRLRASTNLHQMHWVYCGCLQRCVVLPGVV